MLFIIIFMANMVPKLQVFKLKGNLAANHDEKGRRFG
jgi:hypothetical protein